MDTSVKNVVFDVGMVLIDFCWEKHCKELGFTEDVIEAFDHEMIHSVYWEKMDEGTITSQEALDAFIAKMPQYRSQLEQFWSTQEGLVEEYTYATPMIRRLQQEGYKVYLLSNYPFEMYHLHWPTFSFYSVVDGYVVSAVEKLKKPDPAIYELLCTRYALKPSECMFVDDRPENVQAAIATGMQGTVFEGYEKLRKVLFSCD